MADTIVSGSVRRTVADLLSRKSTKSAGSNEAGVDASTLGAKSARQFVPTGSSGTSNALGALLSAAEQRTKTATTTDPADLATDSTRKSLKSYISELAAATATSSTDDTGKSDEILQKLQAYFDAALSGEKPDGNPFKLLGKYAKALSEEAGAALEGTSNAASDAASVYLSASKASKSALGATLGVTA
ncbi:hypothetical protein [Prosthecodimorpha staleyi]|uniref:Uncharacterized protein n=1 Tax=Prosthecodimorpha staleyi TaxID=2840188 RepID=A0A947GI42_9HYPH|nr:hypothetical protein [Prosthecodimorpha staleyi]MBT9288769.1 hypothetical protein [Prosthecodimorpha staleyi]